MTQRKILFLPPPTLAKEILSERAKEILNSLGGVVWNTMDRNYTEDELAELLPGADAVVTSWGSPNFTPELLKMADNLQIVGHAAGTVKNRMPMEGYERGIVVLSAAAVIADSVAEYTLWAMLNMQRNLYRYEKLMKVDKVWKRADQHYGHTLYRKKVGIVSASMVGRQVIKLLQPFHCDIMVYDPYLSEAESQSLGVRKVSLENLFASSDIVTIHAPTTPETKKMIGAKYFQAMQDGAVLVHTARTWVLDEEALIAELRRGRIRATIDVFEKEPLDAAHPIRDLDNAFLTPHISGFTVEIRSRLVEEIAVDIQRFFAGQRPRLAVSADRLKIMA